MKILVINCGSSSLKYQLFDMGEKQRVLAKGLIERIGAEQAIINHEGNGKAEKLTEAVRDHRIGVRRMLELLGSAGTPPPLPDPQGLAGVGHRVVHGGEKIADAVVVDDEVLACVEQCCELAPLHNPANLAGLRAMIDLLPGKPQVAVFDTAFLQTMEPTAYIYGLPYEWYQERRIRRYGFHGTSHRFVTQQAAELLGRDNPNLITLHLGNGATATAVRQGKAIDQSMGFTPLEGLVMGTRCGDIDPAIIFYMAHHGMPLEEVKKHLEKKSGLLGVSGVSNDLRDVEEAAEKGDTRAELALNVYAHRVRRYIGAFLVELDPCHAIVFTAGIGENSASMRARILADTAHLGIELDLECNNRRSSEPRCISTASSKVAVWIIPTNEELMIARHTQRFVDT